MLINLNEAEIDYVVYALQEATARIVAKLKSRPSSTVTVAPVAGTVRLTKAGRPAKKPGRKPGKKPAVKIVEQQAA